ncbi:MAG: hypothetical protein K9H48_17625 [Melioribacteraceae bacterium]|nr:hypothetical protein [Melioribacteraceae bacterium]MCF8395724.1 hypothetical protein [Melioribacteraceae bacterium]MCF8421204.1 hypothetical protein [Melioribacteraceae bacterium]
MLSTGIITSISWHSGLWEGDPEDSDLDHSNYGNVQTYDLMMESLNFGQKKFPPNQDGYYVGHSSLLYGRINLHNSRNVKITFFKSRNYNNGLTYLVGCYCFPRFGIIERDVEHSLYYTYNDGCICALPKHVIRFDNFLGINNELCSKKNYLPKGKKLGQQGFNYINSRNVSNIIKDVKKVNKSQKGLSPLNAVLKDLE